MNHLWTENQLSALKALNIPLYQCTREVAQADTDNEPAHKPEAVTQVAANVEAKTGNGTPKDAPQAAEHKTTEPAFYYYQLGPWTLAFNSLLPVQGLPWLADLSQFINNRPTQINQPTDTPIDCSAYLKPQLAPTEKQTLWALLKPALKANPAPNAQPLPNTQPEGYQP